MPRKDIDHGEPKAHGLLHRVDNSLAAIYILMVSKETVHTPWSHFYKMSYKTEGMQTDKGWEGGTQMKVNYDYL